MAELIVSEIESDDKTSLVMKCDLCRLDGETVDGVIICVDCMDCLCETCSEIHSHNEVFKGHKTVTKDNLPVKFTSQTLHELKDMIFCDIHEVKFEYYCEDHAQFVCHPCMKKAHRSCNRITKIQNVQLSPQSVLSEIYELRTWFQEITKQREELKELEYVERKRQIQLKTTILANIQSIIDQDSSGNKKEDHENDTEAVDLLCDDVKRVVQLQDKYEELLDAVLHINDTEMTGAVSRRVAFFHVKSSLEKSIENNLGRVGNVKKISDRLEILQAVTNELLIASHCEGNGDCFNKIRHIMKETTCLDVDRAQTEIYQDTNEVCVSESSKHAPDVYTNPETAVREARTYKDAEVQTEDTTDTSSTITQCPCTTEHLTASADVDTEPDDVIGPCISQQSDGPSDVNGRKSPDRLDDNCRTAECTQQRDTYIPVLQSRLGEFNVCSAGEEHCNVAGIIVLKDMRVALVKNENDNLKIYDGYMNFKFSYQLKRKYMDICVVDYDLNRVAISFDSKRVQTYEISEDTICYIRGFDLSLYCRGICSMSCNTIAVLVSDVESVDKSGLYPYINSDKDDMEIQIRDINNGRIISCIDTFEKEVRHPVFIIEDNRNNVIIGEINQVSAFDTDGDRLWYYKGYKGRKLDDVRGMAMDPEGNIYVCSKGSNSIHQVSSYNYRNNRVIIANVPSPNCIAYDHHQKRLIVGSDNSCVYVYGFI